MKATTSFPKEPPKLLPQHESLLRAFTISFEASDARPSRSMTNRTVLGQGRKRYANRHLVSTVSPWQMNPAMGPIRGGSKITTLHNLSDHSWRRMRIFVGFLSLFLVAMEARRSALVVRR